MIKTYEEALQWIHSRLRLGIKPGLKRMEWMMEKLDHPERRLKAVHIGGTNGKGSTVTFLRSILQTAGYHTGTFTSPYFEQFNERISVNGEPISDEDIVELVNLMKPLALELEETPLGGPTEFEVITAMAFVYFAKMNPVDIVLLEVGLGGRYDSTNIIHPILSIITSIGLDHTNILGSTLAEIASEKAGIIKSGVPLITGVKQEEALHVIRGHAQSVRSSLYELGNHFSIKAHQSIAHGERFSIDAVFESFTDIETNLIGKHQTENAALAIMAAIYLKNFYAFDIKEEIVKAGITSAYWPGRFEILSKKPLVIIDGAHNEEGIDSLVATVNGRYEGKQKHLLFTALQDKELAGMINKLDGIADEITFVTFDFPRAATVEHLFSLSTSSHKQLAANWQQAILDKLSKLTEEDVFIITGSLYFISEVKPFLEKVLR